METEVVFTLPGARANYPRNMQALSRFFAFPWRGILQECRVGLLVLVCLQGMIAAQGRDIAFRGFQNPPDTARPWVYWFIMDGNFNREGITADLEAMSRVGIGGVILLEVDVGIPRGPVNFMSDSWRALFKHAVREAERLGIEITLIAGPGWTGSGGPWVKPSESMQHLVSSSVCVQGPTNYAGILPQPKRRKAYFGEEGLPKDLVRSLDGFYEDVAVLALPGFQEKAALPDLDEKALYLRHPYSSMPGVKPLFIPPDRTAPTTANAGPSRSQIVDLTGSLKEGGRLEWSVPAGEWTLMRLGRVSTGANTRPAPLAGLGLECDKFDKAALEAHFEHYVGALLREVGKRSQKGGGGWTMLHIDSWEMGAQNWTRAFRGEFRQRRGYDALPYLPVLGGRLVESSEVSERFLWDLRQTAQELVIENHAGHLKKLGKDHGFGLSIEPYDMNPCSDLSLGGVADVPMCEFWAAGDGFNTVFSCIEATSIAHTLGRPIVGAEAFTSAGGQSWVRHPATMKAQADWAFCMGINRLVFHRYAHQPWLDRVPGMTMGPYGTQYERTQTWWEFSGPWHKYLARCQFMLRRGEPVADILYLAGEGAPHVFRPPPTALAGNSVMPDRRGYSFDGCAPETLIRDAKVRDGQIVLAGGSRYQVLVLPESDTMTPILLGKIKDLVEAGATVIGLPPSRSPSLSHYPQCDEEVRQLSAELWGDAWRSLAGHDRAVGRGKIIARGTLGDLKPSESQPNQLLTNAHWIWHGTGNPAAEAPVGQCIFRRIFILSPSSVIKSARLVMTADNSFQAVVNGETVGEGDNFHRAYEFDVKHLLRGGPNELSVVAVNGGDKPNPAGLVGVLHVVMKNGQVTMIPTDASWEAADKGVTTWGRALVLGPFGMGPWGRAEGDGATFPSLYVGYDTVASLMASRGVPPDFEASQPLRYIHRRDGVRDFYFLANPQGMEVQAECRFRVSGKTPELWDPLTGASGGTLAFRQEQKQTVVSISLDPHGSVFVVFDPTKGKKKSPQARRVGESWSAEECSGPWEVAFQQERGAPASVSLNRLQDLSLHPAPDIKHFSGIATYRTVFNPPRSSPAEPVFLDLGEVEVAARVRVNGCDLGVLWRRPFRVEISKALQDGPNSLEIEVANLWPNRLIGDQALPPEKRVTFTTFNPFQADSKLPKSGLLGPVTVQVVKPGSK
jgi:hypothetical protein